MNISSFEFFDILHINGAARIYKYIRKFISHY